MIRKVTYLMLSLLLSLIIGAAGVQAQDVHFSQFYENAPLRNPALTGIFTGDYKAGANYRNQWSAYGVPFITALVSGETKAVVQPATGDHLSFGITLTYDKAGTVNFVSTNVYGTVNYNKSLGDAARTFLSVGLAGGYIQRSIDFSQMKTSAQFVNGTYSAGNATGENPGAQNIRHFDAAAGVSLNSSLGARTIFYLGAAAYHVARPKETFQASDLIRLTTRWSGNFGLKTLLTDRAGLTIHANYQYQQPYQVIIGGALLNYLLQSGEYSRRVVLSAGCFYRLADAVIPTLKLDYEHWALTMSYDISLAGTRRYLTGPGGYELSLFVRGMYPRARRPADALLCPRFEILDNGFQDVF